MNDNLRTLTAVKAAVLILESAPIHDLPQPATVSASSHSDLILIMAEPAEVYLWAQALGDGNVDVHQSHDGTVTHWDWRGEWFDQPFRVTTNQRQSSAVSA